MVSTETQYIIECETEAVSMLKLSGIIVAAAAAAGLAAGTAINTSGPSTASLDADLTAVRTEIAAAEADASKLGGVLAVQANLRLRVLRSTEAMLDQKRLSFLRGIQLVYRDDAPGQSISPDAGPRIEREMAAAAADLASAEAEAARYSGGLILSMIMLRAETAKVTLATLRQQRAFSRYGIPLPTLSSGSGRGAEPPRAPGIAATDRDALR
ncbi:hypothetical protein [Dankookia sp. P2]|uniref:hypothetical protein n=1 Tax=Dankookia sp. P2 TaxID=3423955 RepID=UPI003D66BFE1